MRVLAVIDSLEQGGAEQSLAAIWPYLEENDVDMSFAIFRDSEGPPRRRLEELGATIKILGSASCIGRVRELRSLLREHPVDVVHTSLFEADAVGRMAGRWAGVPVVSTLVSTAPSDPALPRWKQRLVWIFEAGTARLTCRFHAVTAAVADAQSARLRLPRDRVSVVWRGRDRADLGEPATERRRTVRARLDVNRTATIIIAVGRHVPAKGLDVAIGALAILRRRRPDCILLIAGAAGPSTTSLQTLATNLGVSDATQFLGVRNDVPDLLCASDVFVMPSRQEGIGGALIEAAALGVPAVATALPVLREIFPGDFVRWVPPDDEDALAAAIAEAVEDPDESRRRADVSRRWFDKALSAPVTAAAMAELYRTAVTADGR